MQRLQPAAEAAAWALLWTTAGRKDRGEKGREKQLIETENKTIKCWGGECFRESQGEEKN